MNGRRNVAAAMGGWSVRHRVVAVVGWVVFVVVAMVLGSWSSQQHMTDQRVAIGMDPR